MVKQIVIYGTAAFILYLMVYPFLMWHLMEEKGLQLFVIDKTVPKNDYREHLGLFTVLEHNKVRKDKHTKYELMKDYYGYDPEDYKGDTEFEMPDAVDILYVADTYGVYEADLQDNVRGERSPLIYGGLTIFEWNRIMDKKTSDNTLIVEFNSLASPTEVPTRKVVEQNLGIEWSGWIGRYFPDLEDKEVPVWLKKNWEVQTGEQWDLTGRGLVFADETDKVVIIREQDFEGQVDFRWSKEAAGTYEHVKDSAYGYWFDIVIPSEKVTVEANYELNISEQAKKVLAKNGIPLKYPAILLNKDEKTYYFAGDFADVNTSYYTHWRLPAWFYSVNAFFNPMDRFFWEVYVPLMNHIIREQLAEEG
ncbi:hypothetical protein [Priestia abyssalis]|uniref:hypothetical protein n=1 Tax=Priestia abyssalis TaxID=1221450 RepID=UPI0009953E82|nr:hypothetical protein [Priestia abyssalis]